MEENPNIQPEIDEPATAALAVSVGVAPTESLPGDPVPTAQGVELPELTGSAAPQSARSMDLLLDVELPVTVELGHTQMPIKNILELGVGSVVRLEKVAGEPVDIRVNGKLVARGEVVVVDENFGVRILGLIDPDQRLSPL